VGLNRGRYTAVTYPPSCNENRSLSRITYLLMFVISLALIWQGASAIRAM
jgi:hypothetical protein